MAHEITVIPAQKMDSGKFFRWTCSCGAYGKGIHGSERSAEKSGYEHAEAKKNVKKYVVTFTHVGHYADEYPVTTAMGVFSSMDRARARILDYIEKERPGLEIMGRPELSDQDLWEMQHRGETQNRVALMGESGTLIVVGREMWEIEEYTEDAEINA